MKMKSRFIIGLLTSIVLFCIVVPICVGITPGSAKKLNEMLKGKADEEPVSETGRQLRTICTFRYYGTGSIAVVEDMKTGRRYLVHPGGGVCLMAENEEGDGQ